MNTLLRLAALGSLLSVTAPALAEYPPADAPEIVLWSAGAPGSQGGTGKEVYTAGQGVTGFGSIRNIHNPSMYVFRPAKEKATGAGVIVIPGGGHNVCCVDHEGTEIARWLNSVGIAAFVVKYRLANTPDAKYTVAGESLQDIQRALRIVRSRSTEWGVDKQRLGVMGFSAGGQLAFLAATRFDQGKADAADLIDRESSRPDFAAIIYAGRQEETALPADTPPVFMTVAFDDGGATGAASGTLALAAMFKKANVPTELHLYLHGGHGFAMRDVLVTGPNKGEIGFPVSTWNARFRDWLTDVRMIGKPVGK
jgi:endo-1,4-beta-xylanase